MQFIAVPNLILAMFAYSRTKILALNFLKNKKARRKRQAINAQFSLRRLLTLFGFELYFGLPCVDDFSVITTLPDRNRRGSTYIQHNRSGSTAGSRTGAGV